MAKEYDYVSPSKGFNLRKHPLLQGKVTAGVSYVLQSSSRQEGAAPGIQPLPHTVIRPPVQLEEADDQAVQRLMQTFEAQVAPLLAN